MKITVNRSAKNSARCRRIIALLKLITEHDGFSCNFTFVAIFRQFTKVTDNDIFLSKIASSVKL